MAGHKTSDRICSASTARTVQRFVHNEHPSDVATHPWGERVSTVGYQILR
jgi:hypothetical protein